MADKLQGSSSPYLLAHQHNPVDWYPWGEPALQKALDENKPIFLSIGYSACHWCHVMERESFEDPKVADILNRFFVSIKVDREERPDIDSIYMRSVILMTGSGGWPTSVWLTPKLKPFYGGTYFPPTPRHGLPSFTQVLLSVASAWRNQASSVENSAEELSLALQSLSRVPLEPAPDDLWLTRATDHGRHQLELELETSKQGPRFPQPMALRFLLIQDPKALPLIEAYAERMAYGGLYDQLGGGFHRYCVDATWTVPHFEKMLYDNALLLGLYADLAALTGRSLYYEIVDSTIGWLKRDMMLDHGGFASSLDADTHGEEGQYYVWTLDELQSLLSPEELHFFQEAFHVTPDGNFDNHTTVLIRRQDLKEATADQGTSLEDAQAILKRACDKALVARGSRGLPPRDDKAVLCWNAQMVSSLCRAALQLGHDEARRLALTVGSALKSQVISSSKPWPRFIMHGTPQGQAQAEDVASLILACYDLYELTLDDSWVLDAQLALDHLLANFWDEEAQAIAMTAQGASTLIVHPHTFEDNATPSGHSLALECLRRHHRLTGSPHTKALWQQAMARVAPLAERAPLGLAFALQSASLQKSPAQDLILGGSSENALPYLQALKGFFLPHLMVAKSSTHELNPDLSQDKVAGLAYLCSGTSCQPPVTTPQALSQELAASGAKYFSHFNL